MVKKGCQYMEILANPMALGYLIAMPINFVISFAPFFGEEYGWRYYLQPILQKRFGMRRGVLLLGVVWGLWHIFLDFFYYTTPDRGLIMTVSQIIGCVGLGIFFAWAYLKTENIWVPTILHFLNNNLILLVANEYSMEVLENQAVTWEMIPAAFLLNGVLYGVFIVGRIDPVECISVSQQRNGNVLNVKPPAMRVRDDCYTKITFPL